MPTTIKLKNGSGAPTAGQLVQGEVALDLTNKRLYTENAGGTVIEVGTNPTSLTVANNVGIGTSSPSFDLHVSSGSVVANQAIAGFFNPTDTVGEEALLQVGGTLTDNYGVLFGATPEVSTPSLQNHSFIVKTTNGAGMSHTEKMRVTAAGNVGIGTSSPSYALDVSTTASSIGGRITTTTSGSYLSFLDNGGLNGYVRVGSVDNNLVMLAGNAERMRIDSSGNVGIGTSSPTSGISGTATVLQVTNSNLATLALDNTGGKKFEVGSIVGGHLVVHDSTANAERLRIDSSGNVAIGHTNPATKFAIFGNANRYAETDGSNFRIRLAASEGGWELPYQFMANDGTELAAMVGVGNSQTLGAVYWRTDGTERMRLDPSGNLYVGLSTGSTYSRLSAGNGITSSNGNATDTGVSFLASSARGADTGRQFIYCLYNTSSVGFQVFNNGNVENLNNSYGALSDRKLKDNIAPASSQWDDIKAIEVCSYNLKATGEKHIGVIAQQLEEVGQNGLVSEYTERDENGELTEETTKTVKYSVLYMKAIKALQEAMARIETLEAEVAALKGA